MSRVSFFLSFSFSLSPLTLISRSHQRAALPPPPFFFPTTRLHQSRQFDFSMQNGSLGRRPWPLHLAPTNCHRASTTQARAGVHTAAQDAHSLTDHWIGFLTEVRSRTWEKLELWDFFFDTDRSKNLPLPPKLPPGPDRNPD